MKKDKNYYGGLSTEPYRKCIVCGAFNNRYREYCFKCKCSLDTKTIDATTSTMRVDGVNDTMNF